MDLPLLLKRDFPNWNQTPISGFSISASGLVALADLSTLANRTAIVGNSSWLDTLLLAPGIHYQQAAEALEKEEGRHGFIAVEDGQGKGASFKITNEATIRYLQRMASSFKEQIFEIDVGPVHDPDRKWWQGKKKSLRTWVSSEHNQHGGLGWVSHLLYICAPILTISAFVFMILLKDWFGLAFLLALMLSRSLNIWVIRSRNDSSPPPEKTSNVSDTPTKYVITLPNGKKLIMNGKPEDLQAITTTAWLGSKTDVQGYLEAAAKLIIYLVAAFSSNMKQAGSIVFISLLLLTAGLLGLSNAQAKGYSVNKRVISPSNTNLPKSGRKKVRVGDLPYPVSPDDPATIGAGGRVGGGVGGNHGTNDRWTESSGGSMDGYDDPEKGHVGHDYGRDSGYGRGSTGYEPVGHDRVRHEHDQSDLRGSYGYQRRAPQRSSGPSSSPQRSQRSSTHSRVRHEYDQVDLRNSYGQDVDLRGSYGHEHDQRRNSYGQGADLSGSYGRVTDPSPSYGHQHDQRRNSYGRGTDPTPSYGHEHEGVRDSYPFDESVDYS